MFHGRRAKSRTEGSNFHLFDLGLDDASEYFDPMKADRRSLRRLSSVLIRAFSLDEDLVYGGEYFSAHRIIALLKIVRELVQDLPH